VKYRRCSPADARYRSITFAQLLDMRFVTVVYNPFRRNTARDEKNASSCKGRPFQLGIVGSVPARRLLKCPSGGFMEFKVFAFGMLAFQSAFAGVLVNITAEDRMFHVFPEAFQSDEACEAMKSDPKIFIDKIVRVRQNSSFSVSIEGEKGRCDLFANYILGYPLEMKEMWPKVVEGLKKTGMSDNGVILCVNPRAAHRQFVGVEIMEPYSKVSTSIWEVDTRDSFSPKCLTK